MKKVDRKPIIGSKAVHDNDRSSRVGSQPVPEKSPGRSALVKSLIREVTRFPGDSKPKPSEIRKPRIPVASTIPIARQPVDRLALPPASAMEEVDRRLLSGPTEMDDEDKGYEEFDV